MALIQSHNYPYKSLKQHVAEVKAASQAILSQWSPAVQKLIANEIKYAILFHDLGKATCEFQKYIKNPGNYGKNKKKGLSKAHTPVSTLLWFLFAGNKEEISEEFILLVSPAVQRHHGNFPTFTEFMDATLHDYESDFKISEYPLKKVNAELDLELSLDSDAIEFEADDLVDYEFFKHKPTEEAAQLKVRALLVFSVLLESDRTHLALTDKFLKYHLSPKDPIIIDPKTVDHFISNKSKFGMQNNNLNQHRTNLRKQIIRNSRPDAAIESITLPTGLGKTMIAAQWALKNRPLKGGRQKVIIALPFLSILDQTVKEYKELFKNINSDSLILESHSIAEIKYKETDDAWAEQNHSFNDALDFHAETWNSDFIITTFDQLLYTLLSSKKNHLMRFHNFSDALIIIDEIQALPTILWKPLSLALNIISKQLNTKTLIMSATQPYFLNSSELVPNPVKVFEKQNRYRLLLKHRNPISLDSFINQCIERIQSENWHEKRVLLVFNTRASARKVLDNIKDHIQSPVFFLSADVTPQERLENIEKIKQNKPCLVIATQCIEAGVDIDMDCAIRDFAPFDSIIQCAGRCNRNGLKKRADIEVVSLLNEHNKPFSYFVYDQILLEKTRNVFKTEEIIPEKNVYPLMTNYFTQLKESKDPGMSEARAWACWEKDLNVRKMLRDDNQKINFIVDSIEKIPKDMIPLRAALVKALNTNDVWERKRNVKSLSARIAALTVSVWDYKNLNPEDYSDTIGCFYFLKKEFYEPEKGISLGKKNQNISPIHF